MRLNYILVAHCTFAVVSSCDAASVSGQTTLQSSDAVVSDGLTKRLLRTTRIDDDDDDSLADMVSDDEERGVNVISSARVKKLLENGKFHVSADTLLRNKHLLKKTFIAWNKGGLTNSKLAQLTNDATLKNLYHKHLGINW